MNVLHQFAFRLIHHHKLRQKFLPAPTLLDTLRSKTLRWVEVNAFIDGQFSYKSKRVKVRKLPGSWDMVMIKTSHLLKHFLDFFLTVRK